MDKIKLGRIVPLLKGEYSSSTAYVKMDIVTYQGSSYWCVKDCTGMTPTNTTYWKLIASKGGKGDDAVEPFKGWFASSSALSTAYPTPAVGDFAYVKGSTDVNIYSCTTAGTWTDSGTTFNPANNQEFASGQSLNTVHIVDGLDSSSSTDVLSAKQGKTLKEGLDALGPKIDESIGTENTTVDTSIITPSHGVMSGTSYIGQNSSNYQHKNISVSSGEYYKLSGNGVKDTNYAFVKSAGVYGDSIDLCANESLHSLAKNGSTDWLEVPEDAVYLVISTLSGGNDLTPTVVKKGLVGKCVKIVQQSLSASEKAQALNNLGIGGIESVPSIVDDISDVIDIKWEDGMDVASVSDDEYVLYADGRVTGTSSSYSHKLFSIDLSANSGIKKVKAYVGNNATTVCAIAFYSDSVSEANYMKNASVDHNGNGAGWYEAVVPYNAKYVLVSNRGDILATPQIRIVKCNILDDDAIEEAKGIAEKSLDIARIGFGENMFANKPYYYHFEANGFIYDGSHKAIASESLEDIEFAARLGFKCIEANIHKTSDNKFICIHGNSGNFGTSTKSRDESVITTSDLQSTAISSKTLEWIKTNVTYNSYFDKFKTTIPTLEEFCRACKQYGMSIFAGTADDDAIAICIKHFGSNCIIYNPPASIRQYFSGYVYTWNNSVTTLDSLLATARTYGAPYMCGLGPTLLESLVANDKLDELIEAMHAEGFLVGWASVYATEEQSRLYLGKGMDFAGSGHEVNPFEPNYEAFSLDSDNAPTTTGSISNGVITLAENDTITCGSSTKITGKCGLYIRFNGELSIALPHGNARTIESDGTEAIYISDYLYNRGTTMTVTATEATAVTHFAYNTSKC